MLYKESLSGGIDSHKDHFFIICDRSIVTNLGKHNFKYYEW